jgi:hypothetical protein
MVKKCIETCLRETECARMKWIKYVRNGSGEGFFEHGDDVPVSINGR